jgi:hypothetical protein
MLTPVKLHDHTRVEASEVDDEVPDRHLPPEMKAQLPQFA